MAKHKKARSSASKFGQVIGEVFEKLVIEFVSEYLATAHPDCVLLQPEEGKKIVKLEMYGGLLREMDNVVVLKDSNDPVALLETKWLKDARHHNDKGAWILQLREVRKKHATIRGAAAILLGFWTEGVGVMLMSEGGIRMVLVATDEQVYSTLQSPLDNLLGEDTFVLDAKEMRESYIRPDDLVALATHLVDTNQLEDIAKTWFTFERGVNAHGNTITGADLIKTAIDDLLTPIRPEPQVTTIEIYLNIDTGNIIYKDFRDLEEALDFISTHFNNPDAILAKITPKKRSE